MDDPVQGYVEALTDLRQAHPGLVVVFDSAALMEIHHHIIGPLFDVVRGLDIPVTRVDMGVAEGRWEERFPGGDGTGLEGPLLIVSDVRGRVWSTPAFRDRLRLLADRVPIALLYVFGHSHRNLSVMATEPMRVVEREPGEASVLSWEPVRTAEAEEPPFAEVARIPILEPSPHQLTEWARALTGGPGAWRADVWSLDVTPPPPENHPESLTPGERVERFLSTSTYGARELAVRLAQAPVNLAVAEVVQRTIPRPTPEVSALAAGAEIAEVLGGSLMTGEAPAAPLSDPRRSALEFRPGVRRELLERLGGIGTMRSVFHTLGIEFKDVSRVYQWLSRIETSLPEIHELDDAETDLAHAIIPALTEMPGEYRRLAVRLSEVLEGENPYFPQTWAFDPSVAQEEADFAVTTHDIPEVPETEQTVSVRPVTTVSENVRRRPSRRGLAYLGGVPQQNLNFTGREEILRDIHETLSDHPGTSFLVAGSTGIGKTQIAMEYAHRFRQDYDLVWWIQANTSAEIHQAYLRLAQRLGVEGAAGGPELTIQAVNDALDNEPRIGNWLLIFDDVPDLDTLTPALLPLGGSGRVLLTSRDQGWIHSGRGGGRIIPQLSMGESVALLHKICPHRLEKDRATAELIAERLQHLPLALAQMGAYLRDSLMGTDEFLSQLRDKFDQLVDHVEADDQYPLPLAAAWSIQLEDLQRATGPQRETKRLVLEFIKLCSFFAPRPLSRAIFHRARGLSHNPELSRVLGDDMMLSKVLRYAHRHSLADFDLQDNTFQLHATFQSVVQHSMNVEERSLQRALAHRLLAQSDPVGPKQAQNRAEYLLLLSHVMGSGAWRSKDAQVRGLLINLAEFLTEMGDYRTALTLTRHAYDEWSDNPTHRFRVWMVRARCLRLIGDNETCLIEADRMYEEQAALEGRDSEEAMDARTARGIALSNLGDFEEAESIYTEVYQYRREHFGEEDEGTLQAAHNLATIMQRRSRFGEALEIDRVNAERRKYAQGANHIDTLRSRMSMGLTLLALGRLAEARETLEDCADRLEAIDAAEGPHALTIPLMLAVIHRREGEHEKSLEYSTKAMADFSRFHVRGSSTLLLCRSIHMVSLAFNGHVSEAEKEADKVISRVEPLYRDYHPFPWVTRVNAAIVLRAAGKFSQALEMDRQALASLRDSYGDARVTTLPVLINLGNDLFGLGRVQEAREQDREAEERCRSNLDPDHVFLMMARRNHLISRQALGEDVEGEWNLFRQECVDAYGAEHSHVTTMDEFRRLDCDLMPVAN
ncbi:FxSxx-COOH system tetratricopeptide repeat protein [Nocardiopsis sp. JB363]|uniref:FxSxx-COOH system tetratricopeptide repeat protein n=1 Tax=Nocardiopsis sp. JB363 TaxID=1434837 RepID=UPI00097B87E6|nr:FxSxx-COOH system tetratricopeptide repeat protein [Nocardiopsis sp. JB363]SIO85598.1 Putative ATP/GTP-binding protein [Nocardiopsis sp. JB363]